MKVIPICPGSAMANCYLIEHEGHALIVDPCVTVAAILRAVELAGATTDGILLTHGHFDHVLALDSLRDATSAPAYIHESDQILLPDGMKNAFALFFGQDRAFRSADRTLVDGDRIPLGQACVEVIHTPGHTAGSVCYRAGDALLTGDTLFADSFGRYDLYSGDLDTLKASMRRLSNMESDLTIYPGHGECASLVSACAVSRRLLQLSF